jgi:hypothetical protein
MNRKPITIVALVMWGLALAASLIFRGNTIANVALLVISLGVLVLGWRLSRQGTQRKG